MTVLPGLWESHGHLMHVGAADPAAYLTRFEFELPAIMARVAQINLAASVTSFRDVGGPLAPLQALRADIDSGRRPGPRLYLAGPIVTAREEGAAATPGRDLEASVIAKVGQHSVGTVAEARATAEPLVKAGVDQIKVFGFVDQAPLRPNRSTPPPLPPPIVKLPEGESPVQLSRMEVRVTVSGLEAETVTTLTFRNPNVRPLAGDLEFPLPDGAAVARPPQGRHSVIPS